MDRKTFIKAACLACTSIGFVSSLLQSCTSVRYVTGGLNENGMLLDLKEFETNKDSHRSYVIVWHNDLQFPICVYRINETQFSALLMQCTHQGAELQVAGDQLTCPAHGSEFDKWGKVVQSPASTHLRSFPTSIENNQLFIDLRKRVS